MIWPSPNNFVGFYHDFEYADKPSLVGTAFLPQGTFSDFPSESDFFVADKRGFKATAESVAAEVLTHTMDDNMNKGSRKKRKTAGILGPFCNILQSILQSYCLNRCHKIAILFLNSTMISYKNHPDYAPLI